MKRSALVLLLFISTQAFAQTESAFYSRDSAGISRIVNMIVTNTKNKYQADKVIPGRNDIQVWYRFEKYELLRMHFEMQPDRSVMLESVSGRYEDLFPFWKKYFQPNVDTVAPAKAPQIIAPFLNGKAMFIFRTQPQHLAQIQIGYKADPVKPVKPEKPTKPAKEK
jgi:hypothetical protein